jgi:AraC family transcriptional regulator, transcriptional activator of pobA
MRLAMDRAAQNLDFSPVADHNIPQFFLYGEPSREAVDHFLHVEALADRSQAHLWRIRPHAHWDLHHIFHVSNGGAEVSFDGKSHQLEAPFLMIIPAGVVHAFTWETGSDGSVLTVADSYARELAMRDPQLSSLFEAPAAFEMDDDAARASGLQDAMLRIFHETVWDAPCHAAAVEANLLVILVAALRLAVRADEGSTLSPQASLVARFRDSVERTFRTQTSVEDYASMLGVSAKQLRSACMRVAGKSPLKIIRGRALLEARRLLVYSTLSVAEVGYSLGFEDPAYFSRFFADEEGESPRKFRESRRTAPRPG